MAGSKKSAAVSGSAGVLEPLEQPVMGIISAIPIPQFKTWVSAYFHPVETFESNKTDANYIGISTHLALAGLVAWIVAMVLMVLQGGLSLAMALLVGVVIYPVAMILGGFIGSLITFVIAKAFGGKGGFKDQTLALAFLSGASVVLAAPFNILSAIPVLGMVFGFVAGLIGLYNLYNYYLVLRGLHQLSMMRAIGVIVVLIVLAIIVAVIIAAMFAVALVGTGLMAAKGLGAY